jgi:hypothetical protein
MDLLAFAVGEVRLAEGGGDAEASDLVVVPGFQVDVPPAERRAGAGLAA